MILEPEWLAVDGVNSPELAATWCRLSISVDGQVVTRVDDLIAHASRSGIFCSAYPLAEWIATHWWPLRSHVRPAALLERAAASGRPGALREADSLASHDLRAAGDGFLWPRLLIVPQGARTLLTWMADEASRGGPIRYVSSGQAWTWPTDVQSSLAGLVAATIDRLHEMAVAGTLLQEEWQAIATADADEAAFCDAAAALGLDPYDVSESTADSINSIGAMLSPALASEFTTAADPARIHEDLDWITRGLKRISHKPGAATAPLRRLRDLALHEDDDGPPWEIGWRQAQTVRRALRVVDTDPIELGEVFQHHYHETGDPSLQALASGLSGHIAIVAGARTTKPGQRFVESRALWRDLHVMDRPYLLTTAATFEQRIERAFAAELLAPASGIAKLINGKSGVILANDLERIARRFKASPFVIGHQVENQLGLAVTG
jgi:hypothetical protein